MSQPTNFCVAAVDIGGSNLRIALADCSGRILARSVSSTVGIKDPALIVALINTGVDSLLEQSSLPKSTLKAIAAGAPGITNVDTGVVIVTSYLLGWRDVPLRQLLEDSFNIPAAVDNDGKLAALGESSAGVAAGTQDFVFLAIGTGVSAGIVLGGKPFRGMGWTAGEIGYMLLPGLPEEPAPRGKPGALEATIGGEGIKCQWQSAWSQTATTLPKDLSATEILDHAQKGDPLAQSVLANTAHKLASLIYNMSLVLNCPLFVLGGGVGPHPALIQSAQAILLRWGTRVQPKLLPSALDTDAQLHGAIRLALMTSGDARINSLSAIGS